MRISYAITVCNEIIELERLVTFLSDKIRQEDEIVILYDTANGSKDVDEYLRAKSVNKPAYRWHGRKFDGHFADHKNYLNTLCQGDYIFQIDADEIPNEALIANLPGILESNPNNEIYLVPRVNTVEGLTEDHINKWRWNVNENGWVNWPDYQWRIYKNSDEIVWVNKVHERLDGYRVYAPLPSIESLALYHPKDIERQERQNAYYDTL